MPSSSASSGGAGFLLPGFSGPILPDWLADRLRGGLAGVCLFSTNIESPAQLRRLTDAIREANPLALVAIDEEGGDVIRLYGRTGSPYPGNALLGRIDDLSLTARVAADVGWSLRRAGIDLDLAPDVDINSNSDNPVIGTRSFGATAELVSRHTSAWVEALQATGVAASAKHFPGHGDTATDSHLDLPVVDLPLERLRARELAPFVAAIAAGVKTVMTSHILVPQLDADSPATLSPAVLHGLLRDELGFTGVIVTDALDMRGASGSTGIPVAAVRALAAGADLLCIGTDNTDDQLAEIERAIECAVGDGTLPWGRVADAAARNRALAAELRAAVADSSTSERAAPDHPLEATYPPEPDYLVPPDYLVAPDSQPEPDYPLEPAISAFDIRSGVAIRPRRVVVALETTANIAVGSSPWGLAAAGIPVVPVRRNEPLPDLTDLTDLPGCVDGAQLVMVGKDNHHHAWVRELVDLARQRHPSAVVVDMGWPSQGREYADVATFGASRFVGRALAVWLDRAASAASDPLVQKAEQQ